MTKLRDPFYIERKYIIMKVLAAVIFFIYIASTFIGIYSMYFCIEPINLSDLDSKHLVMNEVITNEETSLIP